MKDENPRLISRREAARRIGVSHTTLRRWEKRGIAPRHLVPADGVVMYRGEDVDEWIEKRFHEPEASDE